MKKLAIFGSSGLAREVKDIAEEIGYKEIVFIDRKEGIEPISQTKILSENRINEIEDFDFIIAIGDGTIRKKIANKFPYLNYVNIIHPLADIGKDQKKSIVHTKGNIFFGGVRCTVNIKLGDYNLLFNNITVGHDCIISNFVSILPGANISGNVQLDECCYIGAGAVILQGENIDKKMIIGEKSIVGAGAVVVKEVAPNITVKGVPAK